MMEEAWLNSDDDNYTSEYDFYAASCGTMVDII